VQTFRRHLADTLPDYARPIFLRIVPRIELTGTFKLRKQELALEGYDPATVRDQLYIDDRTTQRYLRLDALLYERIKDGSLRL
jgi:fatty-acyl-CoA synthase